MGERSLNDDAVGAISDHALQLDCARGVIFQPVQVTGRTEGFNAQHDRLPLSDIRPAIIDAGTPFGESYRPAALQPGADQHPWRFADQAGGTSHWVPAEEDTVIRSAQLGAA